MARELWDPPSPLTRLWSLTLSFSVFWSITYMPYALTSADWPSQNRKAPVAAPAADAPKAAVGGETFNAQRLVDVG